MPTDVRLHYMCDVHSFLSVQCIVAFVGIAFILCPTQPVKFKYIPPGIYIMVLDYMLMLYSLCNNVTHRPQQLVCFSHPF